MKRNHYIKVERRPTKEINLLHDAMSWPDMIVHKDSFLITTDWWWTFLQNKIIFSIDACPAKDRQFIIWWHYVVFKSHKYRNKLYTCKNACICNYTFFQPRFIVVKTISGKVSFFLSENCAKFNLKQFFCLELLHRHVSLLQPDLP